MSDVAGSPPRRLSALAPVAFVLTIFVSASLLFFVQPLFAKMVLPVIGGSPAVWTTAMLFFQSVLIGGYLYVHLLTRLVPASAQVAIHVALWAAALFTLPLAVPEGWALDAAAPVQPQALWLFALGVGAPFALLSATAPLLQHWYTASNGPSADDPYFLYGASNLGSFAALLAFPLVAEPLFGASTIALGFSAVFFVLGIGLASCGLIAANGTPLARSKPTEPTEKVSTGLMARWLLLAFLPSSLMLAVTSKISTDIGAVPLVWVLPLALYLLTFVLVFSDRFGVSAKGLARAACPTTAVAFLLFTGAFGPHLTFWAVGLLILSFFIIALWAHRALYEARPPATNLTVFYLLMSVGGALGGVFNSLLAPTVFDQLHEGPVTIALALALLLPALTARPWTAVAPLIAIAPLLMTNPSDQVLADRSFFGLHRVVDQGDVRLYSNGTTIHGVQRLADIGAERPVPQSYYHPMAPMGQVMASATGQSAQTVGIVGLGVGSLACYAQPGQTWHLYEIDAMVDQIARDPDLFTFLSSCTPDAPTHLGDARVVLAGQQDLTFDVLIIDAYSSDAVPVHLTTLEAMSLYMDRLSPGGVLLFHVSNRYYDIGLPLARGAEALGLRTWRQFSRADASDDPGYRASDVVMVARDPADVADLLAKAEWRPLVSDGHAPWTDERANVLSILKVLQ